MRYYFHIRLHDVVLTDPEGIELDGIAAVRTEAIAGAREIMAERLKSGTPLSIEATFDVRDASGAVILMLPFAAVLLSSFAPHPVMVAEATGQDR